MSLSTITPDSKISSNGPLLEPLTSPLISEKNEMRWEISGFKRLAGSHRRETHQPAREWLLSLICTLGALAFLSRINRPVENWPSLVLLLLYPALTIACCGRLNLYSRLPNQDVIEDAFGIVKAACTASLLIIGLQYFIQPASVAQTVLVTITAANIVGLVLGRRLWSVIYSRKVSSGKAGTYVLIIGAGHIGRNLAKQFNEGRHMGYVFKGFLDTNSESHPLTLGKINDLPKIAREMFIDEVFITLPPRSQQAKDAIVCAREMCLDVTVVPDLFEDLGVQAPLEYLGRVPLIELHREPIPVVGLFVKRTMDIVFGTVLLVLSMPIIAILALLVLLDSRGPLFYTSSRVGKKGREFGVHKIRSMVVDAESQQDDLSRHNERDGVLFKMSNDPRVTPIGRFMRKFSLDEIPQFWNVIKGEMSLVGPRPALVTEFLNYDPAHRRRLDVVPGITGLWQVSGRKDPSFDYYVSQDLKYIENWTILLDLKILLKTVPSVLRGTGN